MAYCDSDGSASNMTFLPDIMRSSIPNPIPVMGSNEINIL